MDRKTGRGLTAFRGLPALAVVGALALAVAAPSASSTPGQGSGAAEPRSSTAAKVKKCKKIKKAAKRKECILTAKGKTETVVIGDNYYAPGDLAIRPFDTVVWSWRDSRSREGHDVSLTAGPGGVKLTEFTSRVYSDPGSRFRRTFKKAGTYDFICSLHYEMTMKVVVAK